ncbi:FAD-binding oxidoreductase [Robiginitalea sp. IMCC44478]|uniref:FAD-binding oxidoreductase n=1 Tax=Robiginitalea sp. IMCC44478 TaxID=3459122 RepID=UPI0040415907
MKSEHRITIRKIASITHDVLQFTTDKPEGYSFTPGQATMMAIDREGLREEKRPFTFTCLPEDAELEFTIKIYPTHDGVTDELTTVKVGDSLLIENAWGAINYKGPGTFIAGGAGITPFIAILKDLNRKGKMDGNRLLFANKTSDDIILHKNLKSWLGDNYVNILSEEDTGSEEKGHINRELLEKYELNTSDYVYLCGPPAMEEAVTADLYAMGLSEAHLVKEE